MSAELTTAVVGIAAGAVCGLAAYLLGPWLLRRIPEPELEDGATKVPYPQLVDARTARWCGLVGAIAGGLLGARIGFAPELAAWAVLAAVGAVLGYIDVRTRFLPSAIVWPAYGVVLVLLVAASALTADWDALARAAIAGTGSFAVFFVLWWIYPAGLGYGDVRLSGLLGFGLGWLGWGEVIVGVYGGFVLGAVLGLLLTVAKVFDRKAFAFGPFMLAGAVLGVLAGGPLARGYLG